MAWRALCVYYKWRMGLVDAHHVSALGLDERWFTKKRVCVPTTFSPSAPPPIVVRLLELAKECGAGSARRSTFPLGFSGIAPQGLVNHDRHVIRWHRTRETRAYNVLDDVAGIMYVRAK